jgi:hypothetical protein
MEIKNKKKIKNMYKGERPVNKKFFFLKKKGS